ncbi:MAG: cupin domain-containing protein [bacterium]|nr:MAG: cupin domain-containing protein [bacterium]
MLLPEELKKNPEIEVPVPGIRGWKVGGPQGLVVFFEISPGTVLPEHSHCYQWGYVIEGEIELTIGGERRLYGKGDSYVVPEGVSHSAVIEKGCLAMDYFSDPHIYLGI